MNLRNAIHVFRYWDQQRRIVFTHKDIAKLFAQDSPRALQAGLSRLVQQGILIRACRGIYVYALGNTDGQSDILQQIAKTLRRGEYNYVSLESALSQYGMISQIPLDRLTVMTTGRSGEYITPWGTIEFTHTKRSINTLLNDFHFVDQPLRIATKAAAWRDLKRVGRNTYMVEQSE